MNTSPAAAIRAAQNATVAALAARYPCTATLTAQGESSGTAVPGGGYRGALEWVDEDGVPRRDQGVAFVAPQARFPVGFDEGARGWTITLEGHRFRLLSVTRWGLNWLVRGVR